MPNNTLHAILANQSFTVRFMAWRKDEMRTFKETMPKNLEPEHQTAKQGAMPGKWRTDDIFDNPMWEQLKCAQSRREQIRMTETTITATPRASAESLAWRRGVDDIEALAKVLQDGERITLDEFERIPRLRIDVDTDDFEAGPVVADRATAGTTKKVKQTRLTVSGFYAAAP